MKTKDLQSALLELVEALQDFDDTCTTGSNPGEMPPIAPGHPLHDAVCDVERACNGKLPDDEAREAWYELLYETREGYNMRLAFRHLRKLKSWANAASAPPATAPVWSVVMPLAKLAKLLHSDPRTVKARYQPRQLSRQGWQIDVNAVSPKYADRIPRA